MIMKTIVVVMVLSVSCVLRAVEYTKVVPLPEMERLDLGDITKTPIGMTMWKDNGYSMSTNTGKMVVCEVPPAWSNGGKCGALRVSGVLVNTISHEILGAMGSYVYPSIETGAFAITNEIHSAVAETSSGKAVYTPLAIQKDGSGTVKYWWQSGGRNIEFVIRCFTNQNHQMAVCYYVHTKGDGIHCELNESGRLPLVSLEN